MPETGSAAKPWARKVKKLSEGFCLDWRHLGAQNSAGEHILGFLQGYVQRELSPTCSWSGFPSFPLPKWLPQEDEDRDGDGDGLSFLSGAFWFIPTWLHAEGIVPSVLLVKISFICAMLMSA